MNSQNDQDLEQRLRKLEADLSQPNHASAHRVTPASSGSIVTAFSNWFGKLSNTGRIVVFSVGVLAVLAVLSAILQLVALSIKLAFLAVILYVTSKVFLDLELLASNILRN